MPIASREMGQTGCDIRLTGDALRKFPFAVECKNQEKWSIHKDIEQASHNVNEQHVSWILCYKRNHKQPVIVMSTMSIN
jgi:hypothetical protein